MKKMINLFSIVILVYLLLQKVDATVLKIYKYPSSHECININSFVDEFLTLIEVGVTNINITDDKRTIENGIQNLHMLINPMKREEMINYLRKVNEIFHEITTLYLTKYNKDALDMDVLAVVLSTYKYFQEQFSSFHRTILENFVFSNSTDNFKTPSEVNVKRNRNYFY